METQLPETTVTLTEQLIKLTEDFTNLARGNPIGANWALLQNHALPPLRRAISTLKATLNDK